MIKKKPAKRRVAAPRETRETRDAKRLTERDNTKRELEALEELQAALNKGHVWTAPGWQGESSLCGVGRSGHVFGLFARFT
ncbi:MULTISPECIES: hypothetical protein [Bradyrhizobium]|uniref:hypothetical protein n=1 Tax=Bradyrhizobium TaxID=374 RepID=UPI001EDBDDB2|nr:hypothetical protein [Bradyrhizobium zhengyangense]MCG2645591.1 hypothetical protein [Bradyrhizobium zhengyangense]